MVVGLVPEGFAVAVSGVARRARTRPVVLERTGVDKIRLLPPARYPDPGGHSGAEQIGVLPTEVRFPRVRDIFDFAVHAVQAVPVLDLLVGLAHRSTCPQLVGPRRSQDPGLRRGPPGFVGIVEAPEIPFGSVLPGDRIDELPTDRVVVVGAVVEGVGAHGQRQRIGLPQTAQGTAMRAVASHRPRRVHERPGVGVGAHVQGPAQGVGAQMDGHHALVDLHALHGVGRQVAQREPGTQLFHGDAVQEDTNVFSRKPVQRHRRARA